MAPGDLLKPKKRRQKKKQNEEIIKDNTIRDTRILFEQEKESYSLE